jgi:hypothetical protein
MIDIPLPSPSHVIERQPRRVLYPGTHSSINTQDANDFSKNAPLETTSQMTSKFQLVYPGSQLLAGFTANLLTALVKIHSCDSALYAEVLRAT